MKLRPVTDRAEAKAAFQALRQSLTYGCQPMEGFLGWQGGGIAARVYWNPHLRFWSYLDDKAIRGRYWCCFGTDDPREKSIFPIICEINPPRMKFDRMTAGAFLRDDNGLIYLAHSGKIGGGRKGIGKSAFLAYYGGPLERVEWPDGRESELIVVGDIEGEHFPAQVAHFIQKVERFKMRAAGKIAEPDPPLSPATFSPEFSGQRKSYRPAGTIASRCDHGPVISALAEELERRGLPYGNDGLRDLFVVSPHGRVTILFEAKTDLNTTSIYGGIGQLMLHGAAERKAPRRILVLPGAPEARTRDALEKIGITVLTYGWDGGKPKFPDLEQALG